jgi:hypothetical protein
MARLPARFRFPHVQPPAHTAGRPTESGKTLEFEAISMG